MDDHVSAGPERADRSPKLSAVRESNNIDSETIDGQADLAETRLRAAIAAARFFGVELDRRDFRAIGAGASPSPAALCQWLTDGGLWAKATRLRWRSLLRLTDGSPVVLMFTDGSAGLLTGADPVRGVVLLKDPRAAQADAAVAVDQLRLSQVWAGDVVLVRRMRGEPETDARFTLGWLARMVLRERTIMNGIGAASLVMSVLSIIPPLMVMAVVDKVIIHSSMSTLALLSLIMLLMMIYDTLLGWSRRELMLTLVGAHRRAS